MHKFISFILDIKDKNKLIKIQQILIKLSKEFKKDDFYYVTGCESDISVNAIDPYVLNYHYMPRIPKELDVIYDFSQNFTQFQIMHFILNDNKPAHYHLSSIRTKINKLKKNGSVTIISTNLFTEDAIIDENFDLLEEKFKEIYDIKQSSGTVLDEIGNQEISISG
jgi:hypothetical protein